MTKTLDRSYPSLPCDFFQLMLGRCRVKVPPNSLELDDENSRLPRASWLSANLPDVK